MPTPADVFAEINERLSTNTDKTAGLSATYDFDLSGEGGGAYHISILDGVGTAGPGAIENAKVSIKMAAADFVDMATGKLDGTMAFMTGKISLAGDMALAMKLQSILT